MTETYRCTSYDCPDGGLKFDDRNEWMAHLDESHPITCTTWSCDNLAAYRYESGRGYYYYCAEHAEESWPDNDTMKERIERETRSANEKAKQLPDDHPLEKRLQEKEMEK